MDDVCNINFFREVQHDFLNREVYDIKYLLNTAATSQFKSFFKDLTIDTPEILNHTKSLHRIKGLTYLSRLVLYFSRSGKKIKFSKIILKAFAIISEVFKKQGQQLPSGMSWKTFYTLLTFAGWESLSFKKVYAAKRLDLTSHAFFKNSELVKLDEFKINDMLAQIFKRFNYLFSFYIYKVDKKIYKNSRGKSGKHTFVWKYIAPYKRNLLIMHWLSKEMRISPGKTLADRVLSVLQSFVFNTSSTWIWKIKKFSLNYVYYNLRKTLGETYKTSMR